MGKIRGGDTIPEPKSQNIHCRQKPEIVEHILNEPRFLFVVPKTKKYEKLLDKHRGTHDGNLVVNIGKKKDPINVRVAEIRLHTVIKKRWILDDYWTKFYSIRLIRNQDHDLDIVE